VSRVRHFPASAFHAVERFVARPRVRVGLVVLAVASLGLQQVEIKASQRSHSRDEQKLATDERRLAALVTANHDQIVQEHRTAAAQTGATVQARFSNCQAGNRLRKGLRTNVEQGQRSLPLLLRLLPQLNTPEVLAINRRQVEYQLRVFAPLDCKTYSREILPGQPKTAPAGGKR
jgi:hypothetical protein